MALAATASSTGQPTATCDQALRAPSAGPRLHGNRPIAGEPASASLRRALLQALIDDPNLSRCLSRSDREHVASRDQPVIRVLFARNFRESSLPVLRAVSILEEEEVERRGFRQCVVAKRLNCYVLASRLAGETIECIDVALRRRARVHRLRTHIAPRQAGGELCRAVSRIRATASAASCRQRDEQPRHDLEWACSIPHSDLRTLALEHRERSER